MLEIVEVVGIGWVMFYWYFEICEVFVCGLVLKCYEEIEVVFVFYDYLVGCLVIEMIIDVLMLIVNWFKFLGSLWVYVEQDEEVVWIEFEIDDDMCLLFDYVKMIGDIDKLLFIGWLVFFFDSILMVGWEMVEFGKVDLKDVVVYVKWLFFFGCGIVE